MQVNSLAPKSKRHLTSKRLDFNKYLLSRIQELILAVEVRRNDCRLTCPHSLITFNIQHPQSSAARLPLICAPSHIALICLFGFTPTFHPSGNQLGSLNCGTMIQSHRAVNATRYDANLNSSIISTVELHTSSLLVFRNQQDYTLSASTTARGG